MNYTSVFVVAVLAVLIISTIVVLLGAIQLNFQRARQQRRQMAQRTRMLPLHSMLRHYAIDSSAWLHQQPLREVESAVRNCEACDERSRCLPAMKKPGRGEDFEFCPNADSLKKLGGVIPIAIAEH